MTQADEAGFRRARTEAQRAERRAETLLTARELLGSTRAHDLSLNQIAARAGLAKSGVLRYFGSREAILLEVLDQEYSAWLADLATSLAVRSRHTPIEHAARCVAATMTDRPVLCDLLSVAPIVLEHNVSVQVAATYKRATLAQMGRLLELVGGTVGRLDGNRGVAFVAGLHAIVSAMWAASRPSASMAAAYRDAPELVAYQVDFQVTVRELTATLLTGLAHRSPNPRP